jgi:hypothetical protein
MCIYCSEDCSRYFFVMNGIHWMYFFRPFILIYEFWLDFVTFALFDRHILIYEFWLYFVTFALLVRHILIFEFWIAWLGVSIFIMIC